MSKTESRPFFIVGSQRSGTTMLRLMINMHSRLCVPFESAFIVEFFNKRDVYGDLSEKRNVEAMLDAIVEHSYVKKGNLIADKREILSAPITDYASLLAAIFEAYARNAGKARWGDKTPRYVTDIDVLVKLFPGCKIIHVVRDGRDVALSLRALSWGTKHVPRLAQEWRWKTLLAHKMGSLLGDDYLEVRYEDLVLKSEDTLRCICSFLSEDFQPAMLDYSESAKSEMPTESMAYHSTSVKPPDESKVFKWETGMSAADQTLYEHSARDALDQFGYKLMNRPSTIASKVKSLYYSLIVRW
ncbi:MAG: sulfotransferase [Pseudomonadota bacterium]